jgi:hypothetical protein
VRDRVFRTRHHLAGDEPGEVGHVDHQHGADLVKDVAEDAEVEPAWIRAVAGQDDQGPVLVRLAPQAVVVEEPGRVVDGVLDVAEQFPGDVVTEPVGEVSPGVEVHPEQRVGVELDAEPLPIALVEVVDR